MIGGWRRFICVILFRDNFCGAVQFLVSDRAGRVGSEGLLEFQDGTVEFAPFAHLQAAFDVHFPGLEAGLIEPNAEGGVVWINFNRFLVIVESSVVVLEVLRLCAQVILAVTLGTAGGEQSQACTQDQCSAVLPHHSLRSLKKNGALAV